jgi:predicted DNA-binding helix-hairpin-helix protein
MSFAVGGNLPIEIDPKMAWAQANLSHHPLEINKAERFQLMRVPGIGAKGAEAIINARRQGKLLDPIKLRTLGISAPDRAAPFLLFNGKKANYQMTLL